MPETAPVGRRDESEPGAFARPGWIVSALVVAALVVTGCVLAVVLSDDRASGPGQPAPAAAPQDQEPAAGAPGVPPAPAPAGACPALADRRQTIPATGPAGVDWTLYRTVAMPVSEAAGPAVVEGDVARCFARTPLGALIAAQHISTRYYIAPDWRAVLDRQVAPGPGRDIYARDRAGVEAQHGPMPVPGPGLAAQLAGYRIVSSGPDEVVVQLARRLGDDGYREVTLTMVWQDGDWKLALQPDGRASMVTPDLSSLAGYTPWSGV